MARQDYTKDGEELNIHSMTTRQLRGYIADKAKEAQARLDSADMDEASRAFKDAADVITNRAGTRVRRSTSNMTKAEMREFAYMLRQFNSLDTTSTFAHSIEWKENKQRYETFIRNQVMNDKNGKWAKYITAKGNVSKRGFEEYKQYINFIKSLNNERESYGYETLKYYYAEADKSSNPKERKRVIEKLLIETFEESKGKGRNTKELNDAFAAKLEAYDERIAKEDAFIKELRKAPKKAQTKGKKPKSSNTIKSRQGRKMKEHGKVRR